jgi:DNA repair exonuclease SbcCD ATPase subunit
MRILSVTLRNYRLHRELQLEFDPSRSLIGGANETGKSTIAEAIHRALFLRAKGNQEAHRQMASTLHLGHPEVELAFEAAGTQYLLKKRFGPTGTVTMSASESAVLSGEEAEDELARLLMVESGAAGKAMTAQWAHLWVWQGQAGLDPTVHATAQADGLLHRLQDLGGAGALQSDLDASVASSFAWAIDSLFTQNGKPKAGSELDRAEREAEADARELARAQDRLHKLESAVVDLEIASRDLVTASASLVELDKEDKATSERARLLSELQRRETEQTHAAKDAADQYGALEAAHLRIATIRDEIRALEEILKPQQDSIGRLEIVRRDALSATGAAEGAYRAAVGRTRESRVRRDLALAHLSSIEKQEIHAKLSAKEQVVASCRQSVTDLEAQTAVLPKVDKAKLKKIRKLQDELATAHTTLRAMATGLEVLEAGDRVSIGDRTVAIGEPEILTDDTEVRVGSTARLRIRPGGTTLAEARRAEEDSRAKLQELLDSLGVRSEEHAAEVLAHRDDLSARVTAAEAQLDGMEADGLKEELEEALAGLARAKADVDRLDALAPGFSAPSDKEAAAALQEASERALVDAENHEQQAVVARDTSADRLTETEKELAETSESIAKQQQELSDRRAQLALLLSSHLDDVARNQALLGLRLAKDEKELALKATRTEITSLQPELVESDRTRIKRAISEKSNEQSELRSRVAVARSTLRSDGSEDPTAGLATAIARAESSAEHHRSVMRRAQAIRLLNRLFQEEQAGLAKRLTQPLADKMSGYLQCIFGAGARAQVELETNEFRRLVLVRPGSESAVFEFDSLSGGTKEQTACAVRLAMAELLAEDYDGCLPVVFDDAFANSDPERVNRVQRMLDLAASRGLQVIVLTCNPADYAALGAKAVVLSAPEGRSIPVPSELTNLAPSATDDTDESRVDEPRQDDEGSGSVSEKQRVALLEALGRAGGSKGNQTLRVELGWDERTYAAVKDDLVASGRLIRGKGRGGSVSLTNS